MNERERIELLMKSYGYTPSQFADKIGVQRASVSHILSGRNKASLDVMQKIKIAFPEVDFTWLAMGIGEFVPSAQAAEAQSGLFDAPEVMPSQVKAPAPQIVKEKETVMSKVPAKQKQERQARSYTSRTTVATESKARVIKEVRVFYTDGTFEILLPEKMQ